MTAGQTGISDYPVVLHLANRLVIIIGGGRVGQRKLHGILQTGAQIRLIDPVVSAELEQAPIECLQRPYRPGDLAGADLVFICTDDPATNQAAEEEAEARSIWYNRIDQFQGGRFSLPAVIRRQNLTVAVSTSGDSPAMAALLRDKIAENIPDSWGLAVEIIAAVRRKWLTEQTEVQYNQEVLHNLLDKELIPLIAHGQVKNIDQLLLAQFGPGFSLAELQVQIIKGAP